MQGGLLAALNLLVVALPLIELHGIVSKPIKSCFGALLVRAGFRSAVTATPAVPASDPAELPDAADAELAFHTSQARQRLFLRPGGGARKLHGAGAGTEY